MSIRLGSLGLLGRVVQSTHLGGNRRLLSRAAERTESASQQIIHSSQKPAANREIDFSTLGLRFPVTHTPKHMISRTTWTPPPSSPPSGLPFAVDRTGLGLSLPVYTDYKGGGTKVVTILRKCRGDIEALREDMEKVVGKPVIVRPGKLVVEGNYHARLKLWLAMLGF